MADAHARNHCLECRPNSSELEIGFGRDLCVPDRIPTADGAICRAARRIFRAVARSRVIGIASPCLSALRLERALPAAVLGPRLRAPLRRLAAICLSVAILMITIGGYR